MDPHFDALAGGGISVLFGFFILLGLVGLVLWVWSLIHCIQNRQLTDNNRMIGVILIVVLGLFGSLIYLFLPKTSEPQR